MEKRLTCPLWSLGNGHSLPLGLRGIGLCQPEFLPLLTTQELEEYCGEAPKWTFWRPQQGRKNPLPLLLITPRPEEDDSVGRNPSVFIQRTQINSLSSTRSSHAKCYLALERPLNAVYKKPLNPSECQPRSGCVPGRDLARVSKKLAGPCYDIWKHSRSWEPGGAPNPSFCTCRQSPVNVSMLRAWQLAPDCSAFTEHQSKRYPWLAAVQVVSGTLGDISAFSEYDKRRRSRMGWESLMVLRRGPTPSVPCCSPAPQCQLQQQRCLPSPMGNF